MHLVRQPGTPLGELRSRLLTSPFVRQDRGTDRVSVALFFWTLRLAETYELQVREDSMIIPDKLRPGDLVRVTAPATSLAIVSEENQKIADERLAALGLRISFGAHIGERNVFDSSSLDSRLADLHTAFADPEVRLILAVIGGYSSNQLLRHIDWELIRRNPKVLCGFSDITVLGNAIFAKTGVVTYSGPAYANFAEREYVDFTLDMFRRCLFGDQPIDVQPSAVWTDDKWYRDQTDRHPIPNPGYQAIHEGEAEGTIIGGNLCSLNLLQGTEYMPPLADSILFLEESELSSLREFDRNLQSLLHLPEAGGIRGIVIGRFQRASGATPELIRQLIEAKPELAGIPVVAGADLGHTQSMITFPIGGRARLVACGAEVQLTITEH